ncbi:CapA family protein [Actinopolymorpha pittospori]
MPRHQSRRPRSASSVAGPIVFRPPVGLSAFARLMVATVVAGAVAAACSGPSSDDTAARPTTAASQTAGTPPAARTPTPTGAPKATPRPGPLTLSFAGDIQFESQLEPRLARPATALAPIRPELSAADLTIANLETAVTTGGRAEDKAYTFRTPPVAFDALAAAGIDVVTMANNHGVDYGPEGLRDTLAAAARAPLGVIGIGADADQAFAPYVVTIKGTRIAVLGASAFPDPTTRNYPAGPDQAGVAAALDPERLLAQVRAVRDTADLVVVYLHWGIERVGCPTQEQSSLAHDLAEAGADIVVGSHAHILLGAGRLDGYDTFVSYGLGNFVWPNRNSAREITTGVLTLTVKGRTVTSADWAPATIGVDGLPAFARGEEASKMREDFAGLRSCADLDAVPASARTAARPGG